MTTPDPWDCRGTMEPICPYCGHEQGDFWEAQRDSGEHQCDSCGRSFAYERCVSVDYSTSPIMGPHRQTEWDQQCEREAEEDRKESP
jgi:transcription elongation factor Elf1